MANQDITTMHLRISGELRDRLAALARKDKRSLSSQVSWLLSTDQRVPQPPKEGFSWE